MAITIDQTYTAATGGTGGGLTFGFTTDKTVASNALIILGLFGDPPAGSLSTVTGGSLSWSVDKSWQQGTSGDAVAIASAVAVSGLASGTTITSTWLSPTAAVIVGGISILGADLTSSRVDGTPPASHDLATSSYATNSATLAAGSILIAVCEIDSNTTVSTITSTNTTKSWDLGEGVGGDALAMFYRIESAGGAVTVTGTWGAATQNTAGAVAYKAAAVSGNVRRSTVPFMANGRI